MGANNSTEDYEGDSGDERQPDQTTFQVTYTTGDPISGMKSYLNKHMNLFELLELIPDKYIRYVNVVKIQWLPGVKIDFRCEHKNTDMGDEDQYIQFYDIEITPSTDFKSFDLNKKIRYYWKKSIFTVDDQPCQDGILPEPFNLLVIQSGQLTKSAANKK